MMVTEADAEDRLVAAAREVLRAAADASDTWTFPSALVDALHALDVEAIHASDEQSRSASGSTNPQTASAGSSPATVGGATPPAGSPDCICTEDTYHVGCPVAGHGWASSRHEVASLRAAIEEATQGESVVVLDSETEGAGDGR